MDGITLVQWNTAIALLQDLNPKAEMQKIEQFARRGFACNAPGEYLTILFEQVNLIKQ